MAILVILAGFGNERREFARQLEQSLAELGVRGKLKTLPLLSAVKDAKQVILTIPEPHQQNPEAFLQALQLRHPDAEFTGLGVLMHQEEGDEEYPYLEIY